MLGPRRQDGRKLLLRRPRRRGGGEARAALCERRRAIDLNSALSTILDALDRAIAEGDGLSPPERNQLALCRSSIAFIVGSRRPSAPAAPEAGNARERPGAARVVVVEDDASFREAILAALRPAYRCEGFADAESALVALARDPGVVAFLLDYSLPGMNGLEFLAASMGRFPLGGVPAIVMTSSGDPALEAEAYEAGSVNFARKPCEPAALRLRLDAAVKNARDGEERATRFIRARVERAMEADGGSSSPIDATAVARYGLSPREADVARLLAGGLQAKEIADGLGLSIHTVMNHMRNGYAKCGASNRIEFLRSLSRP